MNKNHVMLSIVLVCMLATQTAVCAQDRAGLINKAQETYRTFKKDIKCVFSKQPCTNEQKKRLIKQGVALTGIVVVLAGLGIGGSLGGHALLKKKRGKRDLLIDPLLDPPYEEEDKEVVFYPVNAANGAEQQQDAKASQSEEVGVELAEVVVPEGKDISERVRQQA